MNKQQIVIARSTAEQRRTAARIDPRVNYLADKGGVKPGAPSYTAVRVSGGTRHADDWIDATAVGALRHALYSVAGVAAMAMKDKSDEEAFRIAASVGWPVKVVAAEDDAGNRYASPRCLHYLDGAEQPRCNLGRGHDADGHRHFSAGGDEWRTGDKRDLVLPDDTDDGDEGPKGKATDAKDPHDDGSGNARSRRAPVTARTTTSPSTRPSTRTSTAKPASNQAPCTHACTNTDIVPGKTRCIRRGEHTTHDNGAGSFWETGGRFDRRMTADEINRPVKG